MRHIKSKTPTYRHKTFWNVINVWNREEMYVFSYCFNLSSSLLELFFLMKWTCYWY